MALDLEFISSRCAGRLSLRWFMMVFFSCLIVTEAFAQQSGIVQSNTDLRAEPSATAKVVGNVSAKSKVEVLDRKAFWMKVKADRGTGWVKMNLVSVAGGAAKPSGLAGLSSGRLGSGNVVSASGTRGLSSEELKTAEPNVEAVKAVQGSAVSREEAARFAAQGKLKSRKIDYVRPPKATSGQGG
ncbi:MAG TPA: SH3 domain-containing protein [Burkholderiales bacterium]|nr:SH3 domain-containing protein [Burkholderiales bacterium]